MKGETTKYRVHGRWKRLVTRENKIEKIYNL